MGQRRRLGETRRRLLMQFVGLGVAIGVVFPIVASAFTVPRSTAALVGFVVLCLLAGVGLGLACALLAGRAAERSALRGARAGEVAVWALVSAEGDWDELQAEIVRLFGDVTGLVTQVKHVNSRDPLARRRGPHRHGAAGLGRRAAGCRGDRDLRHGRRAGPDLQQIAENSRLSPSSQSGRSRAPRRACRPSPTLPTASRTSATRHRRRRIGSSRSASAARRSAACSSSSTTSPSRRRSLR